MLLISKRFPFCGIIVSDSLSIKADIREKQLPICSMYCKIYFLIIPVRDISRLFLTLLPISSEKDGKRRIRKSASKYKEGTQKRLGLLVPCDTYKIM